MSRLQLRPMKSDSLVMGSRRPVLRNKAPMESGSFKQHANICLDFVILNQHLPHPWGTHWNISWQKVSDAETELCHNLIAVCQYVWGHFGPVPLSILVFNSFLVAGSLREACLMRANKKNTPTTCRYERCQISKTAGPLCKVQWHIFTNIYLYLSLVESLFSFKHQMAIDFYFKRKKESGKSFTTFFIRIFFLRLEFPPTFWDDLKASISSDLVHFSNLRDRCSFF